MGYIAPEYVIEGYLTEKADVYSFGVLVLELMSGRRCVDKSKDSPPLLEFAKVLQKKRNLISLLDQDLTNIPRNEATMVLDLAMLCTSHSPKARPNISDVVKILEGKNVLNTPLQELDDLAGVTSDEMTLSDFSYYYMDSCRKEIVKGSNIGKRADYSRSSMMGTNFPTSETPISNVNASSTSTTLEKNITEMADEAELEYIEPQLEEGKYRIECSNEEFKIGCNKWNNSLVGYLLNENGTFDEEVDEAILREMIPAGNGYSVFCIGSGHYLFQFSCVEDKIRGLESSGLLRVEGKPLVLIKWDWKLTLNKAETMKSIPSWVKIYNLPLFLWNSSCLSKVVSAFGIPICADQKTIKQQRLDYARVYMKVDARKPLLDSFLISVKGVDYLLKLEYDWKPLRDPFPVNKARRVEQQLEIIHSDLCGPIEVTSHGGNNYFITFVDDFSRKAWVYLVKQKVMLFMLSEVSKLMLRNKLVTAGTLGILAGLFHLSVRRLTFSIFSTLVQNINILRTDRGTKYTVVDSFMEEHGILHQLSARYTPQQNGVAERKNKTIMEMAISITRTKGLPKHLWGYAVDTAVYLLNRCPTNSLNNITREEAWRGVKPSVRHLRIFG
ncbi:uncharacterized protein LOC113329053 [Papaver somniferum]|uniref:uncharacterized protein LOC113329053 n=1 Tax=Papaver somniferum TaxID=3469 RepID=UPI000E6FC9FA|nr:uncharacterized protein LOC113329053 [Papaver somniferum]